MIRNLIIFFGLIALLVIAMLMTWQDIRNVRRVDGDPPQLR